MLYPTIAVPRLEGKKERRWSALLVEGDRAHLYAAIKSENDKLKDLLSAIPHDLEQEAFFFCQSVKPQMDTLR